MMRMELKHTPPAELRVIYHCGVDGCDVTDESPTQRAFPGSDIFEYGPPLSAGWRILYGRLICPKHKIEVRIDGELLA